MSSIYDAFEHAAATNQSVRYKIQQRQCYVARIAKVKRDIQDLYDAQATKLQEVARIWMCRMHFRLAVLHPRLVKGAERYQRQLQHIQANKNREMVRVRQQYEKLYARRRPPSHR
jgi:hypothetical protein